MRKSAAPRWPRKPPFIGITRLLDYPDSMLPSVSQFLRGFVQLCCATLVLSCPVYAYTTSTCEEEWYVPAQGQKFTGTHASWNKVKEGSCKSHDVKNELKVASRTRDDYTDASGADESEIFAMVGGDGYYIHSIDVQQGPYCGGGDVAGFDPQCALPPSLRHNEIHHHRYYYQVTSGRSLYQPAECEGAYATDGKSIFYLTHDYSYGEEHTPDTPFMIKGSDVVSFKCFVPQGNSIYSWARDAHHVFLDGRLAGGMSPEYPVMVFRDAVLNPDSSDLATNNGKVFSIDLLDGVKFLPEIGDHLKIMSKYFFLTERVSSIVISGK
jgi:hypothetical protein